TSLFQVTSQQLGAGLQVDFKTLLIGAVYEKSLRLSQASSREFTQGQILNVINVDVEKVSLAFLQLAMLLTAPVQVVVSVILLGNLIGYAVWGGAGTLFAILFLQLAVIGFLASYQKSFLQGGDRRLKLIREVLYGMKIIKFRALERFFIDRINSIRLEQLSILKKYYSVQAYFVGLIQIAPISMPIVAFLVYGSINGKLTPAIIFPALSLFNQLFQPILTIPQSLTAMIVAVVSWKRIVALLMADESDGLALEKLGISSSALPNGADQSAVAKQDTFVESEPGAEIAIRASDLSFKWEQVLKQDGDQPAKSDKPKPKRVFPWQKPPAKDPEAATEERKPEDAFSIANINLSIKRGQKVAIVGAVGSGKSS
ncbi:hypothetical protein HDU91_003634, partial [Kappamyces sp. JEL0680]